MNNKLNTIGAEETGRSVPYAKDQLEKLLKENERLKKQNAKLRQENKKFRIDLEHLNDQANRDFLTGIYNRKGIGLQIDAVLKRSFERAGVLCFLEIENFKEIKDQQGHSYAEELLCEMVSVLQKSVRKTDLIGRVGENEFLLYMRGIIQEEYLRERMEEIQEKLFHFQLQVGTVDVRLMTGLARFPVHGKTFSALLEYAAYALLQSKKELFIEE